MTSYMFVGGPWHGQLKDIQGQTIIRYVQQGEDFVTSDGFYFAEKIGKKSESPKVLDIMLHQGLRLGTEETAWWVIDAYFDYLPSREIERG